MRMPPITRPSNEPLGTGGDLPRRGLLHHVRLALASVGSIIILMTLPNPHVDHGGAHTARMNQGGGQTAGEGGGHAVTMPHGGGPQMAQNGDHAGPTGHGDGEARA